MRDVSVLVRLSEEEALRLDECAREQGLKRATYMRMATLEKIRRDNAAAKKKKQRSKRDD